MTKLETNFYLTDEIIKSITPLLLKIQEEKKHSLILCEEPKIKEIDDILWKFSKTKFLPHSTKYDEKIIEEFGFESQPIFITSEEKNFNSSQYLIITCNINSVSKNFLMSFKKIFYFYDYDSDLEASDFAKKNDFLKITSYKKDDSKWIKAN